MGVAGEKLGSGVRGCIGERRECREGRLGASVFGYSDAYRPYRAYVLRLRGRLPAMPRHSAHHTACCAPGQQQGEGRERTCEEKQQQQYFNQQLCDWWRGRVARVPPVYMAVCDVAQAYDTIPHAKLLEVMQEFVETPAYIVRRFSAISPRANGLITPRSHRAAMPMALPMPVSMAPEHPCAAVTPATVGFAMARAAADEVQGAAAREAVEAADSTAATQATAVPPAAAAAVVAVRPWQQQQQQACVPWWCLVQARQSGACIVEDKGLTSLWRRDHILQLLRRHISCHVIRAGRQFFLQQTGIPQGSVLSALLCSLFYAHLDRYVLLPSLTPLALGALPPPEERVYEEEVGDGGEMAQGWEAKRRFIRWAGLLVNCSTLEVQADYTRYWGTDMATAVTVSFCDPPSTAIPTKLRQFLRPKCCALLLDPAINSPPTLLVNAYQALRLAAIKLTAYCRARRLSPAAAACTPRSRCHTTVPRTGHLRATHRRMGQSKAGEEKPWKKKRGGASLAARGPCVCHVQAQFFTHAIISAINYYAGLIRLRLEAASKEVGEPIPCIFTANIVTFLGLSAFTMVFNAKRGVWKGVVVQLQERLRSREMAAVRDDPVVKQALHPSRHSVFEQIRF
ncbi:unnamed protein product [Closterium sp. Yama58-4]|nr:unnamed protein product [Closterium sp. Yama58-4]